MHPKESSWRQKKNTHKNTEKFRAKPRAKPSPLWGKTQEKFIGERRYILQKRFHARIYWEKSLRKVQQTRGNVPAINAAVRPLPLAKRSWKSCLAVPRFLCAVRPQSSKYKSWKSCQKMSFRLKCCSTACTRPYGLLYDPYSTALFLKNVLQLCYLVFYALANWIWSLLLWKWSLSLPHVDVLFSPTCQLEFLFLGCDLFSQSFIK